MGFDPEDEDDSLEEREPDPVVLTIEDSLDLHTFRPEDLPELLPEYLAECRRAGWREVRIIHGKGRGRLGAGVKALLARLPGVVDYYPAPPDRGGWGAMIVILESEIPPEDEKSELGGS